MSGTTTPAPLISSSPANQATAAASNVAAAAVMTILIWVTTAFFHVDIPSQVAVAMGSLVGMGVHWAVLKYGIPTPP